MTTMALPSIGAAAPPGRPKRPLLRLSIGLQFLLALVCTFTICGVWLGQPPLMLRLHRARQQAWDLGGPAREAMAMEVDADALAAAGAPGFTIIIQVYNRPVSLLAAALQRYAACRHATAALVVDNHPNHTAAAAALTAHRPDGSLLPLTVVSEASNSMNNRFRPRGVATAAVFLVDDDIELAPADVDFAYEVWARHPSQLVGFLPRAHDDTVNGSLHYVYGPLPSGEFSMVLLGASFFAARYMEAHWAATPRAVAVRAFIDEVHNCDDVALNFLIAKESGLPPIVVHAPVGEVLPLGNNGRLLPGMSADPAWRPARVRCLSALVAIYGRLSLKWSNAALVRETANEMRSVLVQPAGDGPQQQQQRRRPRQPLHLLVAAGAPLPSVGVANGTVAPTSTAFGGSAAAVGTGTATALGLSIGMLELLPRGDVLAGLERDGAFTVEGWLRPSALLAATQCLICSRFEMQLGLREGRAFFRCAGDLVLADDFVLQAGAWTHLAGVRTGQHCELYVDGRLAVRQPSSGGPGASRPPRGMLPTLSVGALRLRAGTPSALLHGEVQELRVWTRALRATELRDRMGVTLASSVHPPPDLLAVLPLGSRLDDATGQFDVIMSGSVGMSSGLALYSLQEAAAVAARPTTPHRAFVSAVLTSRFRPQNLPLLLGALSHYAFIAEIIVWNNNVTHPLNAGALTRAAVAAGGAAIAGVPPIRVFNANTDIFTEGKYRGCVAAVHAVCYVQDDDFAPGELGVLAASFASAPSLLHVLTDMDTALINARWTFFNASLGLHAGFAWLGTGAMLPRAAARHFLRQADAARLDADARRHADLYYSLWMNELPVVLPTWLVTVGLEQGSAHSCATCVEQRARNVEHFQSAVRILVAALQQQRRPNTNAMTALAPPRRLFATDFVSAAHHLRALKCPCRRRALVPACAFVTSMETWPDPEEVPFDVEADLEGRAVKSHPGTRVNATTTYGLAVDGDPGSAWAPGRPPRARDFIGLDLLEPQPLTGLSVTWSVAGGTLPAGTLEVSVDCATWDEVGACAVEQDTSLERMAAAASAQRTNVTFRCSPKRARCIRWVFASSASTTPLLLWELEPRVWVPMQPSLALGEEEVAAPGARRAATAATPLVTSYRLLYVATEGLGAGASGEARALAEEAVALAGGGATVDLLIATSDGAANDFATLPALVELLQLSAPPRRLRVLRLPRSPQRYTHTPATPLMRRSLDMLDWLRSQASSNATAYDAVVFPVWRSPLLHALRAHELDALSPQTVFAARLGSSSLAALHSAERFASGVADVADDFFETGVLRRADAIAHCGGASNVGATDADALLARASMELRWRRLGDHRAVQPVFGAKKTARVGRGDGIITVTVLLSGTTSEAAWRRVTNAAAAALSGNISGGSGSSLRLVVAPLVTLKYSVASAVTGAGPGAAPPLPVQLLSPAPLGGVLTDTAQVLLIVDGGCSGAYFAAAALSAGVPFIAPSDAAPSWLSLTDASRVSYEPTLEGIALALRLLATGGPPPLPRRVPLEGTPAGSAAAALAYIGELLATRAALLPSPSDEVDVRHTNGSQLSPLPPPPLVSVCIATYGRSRYLAATVASVLGSDYPSLELIVADDGSSDPSDLQYLDILGAQLAARRDGSALVRLAEHAYAPAARNAAIARARGKYVLLFDSDDLLRPNAVRLLVATAERTRAHIVVGWVEVFRDNSAGGGSVLPALGAPRHVWAGAGASAALGLFGNAFGGGSALVLRSVLAREGGYAASRPGVAHLDYELLSRLVTGGATMELLPAVTYDYRAGARGSVFSGSTSTFTNQRHSLAPYSGAHTAGWDAGLGIVAELAFAGALALPPSPPPSAQAPTASTSCRLSEDEAAGPRDAPYRASEVDAALSARVAGIDAWLFVNLDDRCDRRAAMLAELRAVGAPPDRVHRVPAQRHRWPAVGCALSHVRALRFARDMGWGRFAVLEDDLAWRHGGGNASAALGTALRVRPDADVLLGAANERTLRTVPDPRCSNGNTTLKVVSSQIAAFYVVAGHYVDTLLATFEEAAQKLERAAAAWEESPPESRDTRYDREFAIDQYWKRLMPGGDWVTTMPTVALQREGFSDIEGAVVKYS